MTSKGLGEMFEGDSADMCAEKFPLVWMGAERRVSRAQNQERGPPSALAEISKSDHQIRWNCDSLCFVQYFPEMCLRCVMLYIYSWAVIKKYEWSTWEYSLLSTMLILARKEVTGLFKISKRTIYLFEHSFGYFRSLTVSSDHFQLFTVTFGNFGHFR